MEEPNSQRPGTRPSGNPRPSRLPVLSKRPSQILGKTQNGIDPRSRSGVQVRGSAASLPRNNVDSSTTSRSIHAKTTAADDMPSIPQVSKGDQVQQYPQSTTPTGIGPDSSGSSLGLDDPKASILNGLPDSSSAEHSGVASTNGLNDARMSNGSRPTLAERTVDSISSLPATPATDRRRSSFFNPVESPMGPPPRPGSRSSSSRPGTSNGSRPGTSEGKFIRSISPEKRPVAETRSSGRMSLGGFGYNAKSVAKRATSISVTGKPQFTHDDQVPEIPPSPSLSSRSPSPSKRVPTTTQSGFGELGNKKSTTKVKAPTTRKSTSNLRGSQRQHTAPKSREANGTPQTAIKAGSLAQPLEPVEPDIQGQPELSMTSASKAAGPSKGASATSSSVLRQQIAAAKAAAKTGKIKEGPSVISASAPEYGDVHADPFNQAPKDDKHVLRNRVMAARMDGKLNIAALGLKAIPSEVLEMYTSQAMEESNVNWAEVVDLTKFIAADNELEQLEDHVFPDKSADDFNADEDSQGNQFGGLETLDLHGNILTVIPTGLRRLERLTVLNLAHNKLDNSMLDIVAQIGTLKELRLANNNLSGTFPTAVCQLSQLELLDLQANRVLSLPEAIRDLSKLKRLNISGNQITTLPMEALSAINLVELNASNNALIASLFPLGGEATHATLRTLDVSNNSLAALAFTDPVNLPELQDLNISNNHLTVLPPVAGWTQLRTLMAGENKISELPAGFSTLKQLRNVSLGSNDIRMIDPSVGKMDSLVELVLAGNPLQQKKYLSMTGPDIKSDLRARLETVEDTSSQDCGIGGVVEDADDDGRPSLGRARSSTAIMWTLKPGGTLDLALKGLSDDINDSLGSFLKSNEVRQLLLQQNRMSCIPPALWLGQDIRVLDLRGNDLGAEYLSEELELPALTELNLSQCKMSSLQPLITNLKAPRLESLNITANRIGGTMPMLRESYPSLSTFFAGDNKFTSISADALRGMHTVNLANNHLQALPAEIGLLWDEGLRAIELGGNAFRVPSYTVLEKGTEAVMNWLKQKLPAQESWHDDELD